MVIDVRIAGPARSADCSPHPASETGFRELMTAHEDRLFNFVARLVGNREDAEEIVQDTFAKAYRAMQRANGERPIDPTAAWFYTIALNTVRNRVRRRRVATVPLDGEYSTVGASFAHQGPAPDVLAERRETWQQIQTAIARLPVHQRAPVILRFINELTYEEIATIVGCPVGTAKSHVHRGVQRLRAELAPVFAQEGES